MKRYVILFVMLLSFTGVFAQQQWYRTTAFAMARVYNGNYSWGNWESSDVSVCIDFGRDVVTIYSPRTQVYKVVTSAQNIRDNSGTSIKFKVIDQDGDRGTLRLRIENNGNSQLYIDFNDVAWVYNVVRR